MSFCSLHLVANLIPEWTICNYWYYFIVHLLISLSIFMWFHDYIITYSGINYFVYQIDLTLFEIHNSRVRSKLTNNMALEGSHNIWINWCYSNYKDHWNYFRNCYEILDSGEKHYIVYVRLVLFVKLDLGGIHCCGW